MIFTPTKVRSYNSDDNLQSLFNKIHAFQKLLQGDYHPILYSNKISLLEISDRFEITFIVRSFLNEDFMSMRFMRGGMP